MRKMYMNDCLYDKENEGEKERRVGAGRVVIVSGEVMAYFYKMI